MQLRPILSPTPTFDLSDPEGVLAGVVRDTLALYEARGFVLPWIGYVAVDGGQAIGTCGFAGPPHGGEVEIAYYCFPAYQGRGLATKMARLLIETHQAAAEAERCRFIAHTLPDPNASSRILGKLGFVCLGDIIHPEDGRIWKWQLDSPPGAR